MPRRSQHSPADSASGISTGGLVQPLLEQFHKRTPLRTGSLIVTMFGDAIAPRGGTVWLGSLINVVAPLRVNHRLVRTAVFRLVKDGVLNNEQVGRKSYYSLTEGGRRQFAEATNRIYATNDPEWDGKWHLLLLKHLTSEQRLAVRKDLQWLGYGAVGPDLLAHPRPDTTLAEAHLKRLQMAEKIIPMNAELPGLTTTEAVTDLVRETWKLAELETAYNEFVQTFHPILSAVKQTKSLTSVDAYYLRTFLIHEYRKVLLRDPALPEELLPATWKGRTARQLTAELYPLLVKASEIFVDDHFENQIGALPPPGSSFAKRFKSH